MGLSNLRELLTDSEVDHRELDLALFVPASADVLWFQVAV